MGVVRVKTFRRSIIYCAIENLCVFGVTQLAEEARSGFVSCSGLNRNREVISLPSYRKSCLDVD